MSCHRTRDQQTSRPLERFVEILGKALNGFTTFSVLGTLLETGVRLEYSSQAVVLTFRTIPKTAKAPCIPRLSFTALHIYWTRALVHLPHRRLRSVLVCHLSFLASVKLDSVRCDGFVGSRCQNLHAVQFDSLNCITDYE